MRAHSRRKMGCRERIKNRDSVGARRRERKREREREREIGRRVR